MSDSAFERIELDTYERCDASPDVDTDTFRGLAFAMPAKVGVDGLERLPLCGVWVFDAAQRAKLPEIPDSVVYLARDLDTHASFTGAFTSEFMAANPGDVDDSSPPARPARAGEETVLMGWFNLDLARWWHVPARPGRWRVTLSLHEFQSAPVDFEVTK